MALKIVTTILLKVMLINFVFIACVCHAQSKIGKRPSKPAGGGMDKKPSNPETCTCETFKNLCNANSMLDLRIANFDDEKLVCNPYEYQYCNTPTLECSYRRIKSNFDLFGAYPWHVDIYDTSRPPNFLGSGVLIKKQYVLTAAHKVVDQLSLFVNTNKFLYLPDPIRSVLLFLRTFFNSKSGVKLRLGEWDRVLSPTCNTLELKSSKIVIHPEYNTKLFTNNIALIKLEKEVDIAQYPHINTACLASHAPAAGTPCTVAGWGVDMFNPSNPENTSGPFGKLNRVTIPIVAYDKCEQSLKATRLGPGYKLNRLSFICAGGELGHDTCTGDGGSPLMCPNGEVLEVAGLTVGGIGCRSTVPGLYTNVPNYKDWIDLQIFNTIDD